MNVDKQDLIIDADIEKQTDQIRIANIEQYNLSRGQKITLPDGDVRTIVGFKEEFIESYDNSQKKYTVIIVDKPFNDNYTKFFVKKSNDSNNSIKKVWITK